MKVQKTDGVTIPSREMFDSIQKIKMTVTRLESKMEGAIQADERSREALEKAKDAEEEAKNAHKRIKRIEDKIDKLMISVILALVSGAVGALFLFAQKGIGG